MNNALVTIAPAMEALTRTYCPARNAARAMSSSVRFPSVALSRPPIISPVLVATDSVARLSKAANGTIAMTESTNRSVCASGLSTCAAKTTGTSANGQSNGLCRISLSKGVTLISPFVRIYLNPGRVGLTEFRAKGYGDAKPRRTCRPRQCDRNGDLGQIATSGKVLRCINQASPDGLPNGGVNETT